MVVVNVYYSVKGVSAQTTETFLEYKYFLPVFKADVEIFYDVFFVRHLREEKQLSDLSNTLMLFWFSADVL